MKSAFGVLRHHAQQLRNPQAFRVARGHVSTMFSRPTTQFGQLMEAQRADDALGAGRAACHKRRNRHAHGRGANVQLPAGRCGASSQFLLRQLVLAATAPIRCRTFPSVVNPAKLRPRVTIAAQAFFERTLLYAFDSAGCVTLADATAPAKWRCSHRGASGLPDEQLSSRQPHIAQG